MKRHPAETPGGALAVFVRDRYNKHGMAALAGALDTVPPSCEGLEVRFLSQQDVVPALREDGCRYRKVLLACSFHTPHLPAMAAFVARTREALAAVVPRLEFLAGGTHPSGDPVGTIQAGFDSAFHGEGEAVVTPLLERWTQDRSLESLPGLVVPSGDSFHFSPPPPPVNLDDFLPFSVARRLLCPVEITRGCPGACGFCQTPFLFGSRVRHRSLDRILAACEAGRARSLKDLRFSTPNAFAFGSPDGRTPNPAGVEALLRETGKLFGREHVFFGSFPSETRPESVTVEVVDLVRRLAGNDNLVVGLQSGSDAFLERLGRGHTTADVFRAVEIARAAGFRIYVDFIFGLPGETEADRRATETVMEKLSGMGAIVHGHAFIPLPGTPLGKHPPSRIDERTRQVIDRLPPGLHCGRWKHQEAEAFAAHGFRTSLRHRKPSE